MIRCALFRTTFITRVEFVEEAAALAEAGAEAGAGVMVVAVVARVARVVATPDRFSQSRYPQHLTPKAIPDATLVLLKL